MAQASRRFYWWTAGRCFFSLSHEPVSLHETTNKSIKIFGHTWIYLIEKLAEAANDYHWHG